MPASELLRQAVRAGLEAAERSGGLVDPTLLREIEGAGYVDSRAGMAGVPLGEALPQAPAAPAGAPEPGGALARLRGRRRGRRDRPPARACCFDTGGTGKGLAADLVAAGLRGYSRFVVDCGGDIRIGGADALVDPYEVFVEHPLSGERAYVLRLGSGGVATSGLNVRIWRGADGRYAHHLLDPATGEPAWTGLVGATALADTAVEAETLSKAALLSGPEGGRQVLAERGGLLVHDSGRVELVGPLAVAPRIRIPESAWLQGAAR